MLRSKALVRIREFSLFVILEFYSTLPWTVELVTENVCLIFYYSTSVPFSGFHLFLPIMYSIVEGTLCLILFIFLRAACPVSNAICISQRIMIGNSLPEVPHVPNS